MSKKLTPGQSLLASLYRADAHEREAAKIVLPANPAGKYPPAAAKRWSEGMSRHLKEKFATNVRQLRERLGVTQHQLADSAGLTATAVAMIERGERVPNLDTATRLCWALDTAAGVKPADLT
jgi:DNA-binding XRE family transcriptional regulator